MFDNCLNIYNEKIIKFGFLSRPREMVDLARQKRFEKSEKKILVYTRLVLKQIFSRESIVEVRVESNQHSDDPSYWDFV